MPVPAPQPEVSLLPERCAVRVGRREVALSPTEFRLLARLVAEPGRALTRAELVERVIGTAVAERTVRCGLIPSGGIIDSVAALRPGSPCTRSPQTPPSSATWTSWLVIHPPSR